MVNEKAEEKINLVDKILEQIKVYREEINAQEVGIVLDSGDGIARIGGLPGALVGEMLYF